MDPSVPSSRWLLVVAAAGVLGGCSSDFWDRSPRVAGSREADTWAPPTAGRFAPPDRIADPRPSPAPETWRPSPGVTSAEERALLAQVSRLRMGRGLRPLRYSPLLHSAAEGHSLEQYRYGYMGHHSPDPSRNTLAQRMAIAGYRGQVYSEVVAWGYRTPEEVLEGWMNSPSHREVLLDPEITEGAFSRVSDYWTGNFGAPRWSPGPEDYDPVPSATWRAPAYVPPAPPVRPAPAPAPRAPAPAAVRPAPRAAPPPVSTPPPAPRPAAPPRAEVPEAPPPAPPPPAKKASPLRPPPAPSGGG